MRQTTDRRTERQTDRHTDRQRDLVREAAWWMRAVARSWFP